MSANLFGERFIERQGEGRQRAWHHLGLTFDATEQVTAADAVRRADLNYRVGKFPLMADLTPRDPETGKPLERNGKTAQEKLVPMPGHFALVREAWGEDREPRFFGEVGSGYTVLQNLDLAKMVDKIATGYTVETAGALGYGETFFLALSAGRWDIRGDEIEDYLVVSDRKDGAGGVTFLNTPVRVVCQNTLSLAMSDNTAKVSLTHSAAVKAEASELLAIFNRMTAVRERQREALTGLTEIKLTADDAKAMIEAIYPEPEKPSKVRLAQAAGAEDVAPNLMKGLAAWESQVEQVQVFRAKVEDLKKVFDAEFPRFAGTGYALYNAITEHEDHYRRGRNVFTRAESAVFGDRALLKSRAFDLIAGLK